MFFKYRRQRNDTWIKTPRLRLGITCWCLQEAPNRQQPVRRYDKQYSTDYRVKWWNSIPQAFPKMVPLWSWESLFLSLAHFARQPAFWTLYSFSHSIRNLLHICLLLLLLLLPLPFQLGFQFARITILLENNHICCGIPRSFDSSLPTSVLPFCVERWYLHRFSLLANSY